MFGSICFFLETTLFNIAVLFSRFTPKAFSTVFAFLPIAIIFEFAFKISVGSLEKLAAVAERYALIHLDKPLKSYDFLKSLLP